MAVKYCMECKFIKHGIALSYDQIVKPCCAWKTSDSWRQDHHLSTVDIKNWHNLPAVIEQKNLLELDQWPKSCVECKKIEIQNRQDSMRGNGNHAYADYKDNDIALEIRPGNTCNFACQTCWPEASSRVAQYHNQAGLINIKNLNSQRMENFDFLLPIADQIRDVVLLGGEPFYDKSCLKFLAWARQNLKSNIMMFTNGSIIDLDFLKNYPGKLTVIFSLDAVEKAAEYVRYGTIWQEVLKNYAIVKSLPNIETRVNITCSVYNYTHLEKLIEWLSQDWPSVVSFGTPFDSYLRESSIPPELRTELKQTLSRTIDHLTNAPIPTDQKNNAINAVSSIVCNLDSVPFDPIDHQHLVEFIAKMDRVKQINAENYCEFLRRLQQEVA
jgi:wyosine [tRNA(Phe)-imidazoG37] synthetase (radical SAM superfamily)